MPGPSRRDSTSQGFAWASRATSLAMEFALPALAGVGVDRLWRFAPAGVVIGAALGFVVGMFHLLQIAKQSSPRDDRTPRSR